MVGNLIFEKRRAMNLSRKEFAKMLNISYNYLTLIETNKRNVGKKLSKKIAEILGVDEEDLEKNENKLEIRFAKQRLVNVNSELKILRQKIELLEKEKIFLNEKISILESLETNTKEEVIKKKNYLEEKIINCKDEIDMINKLRAEGEITNDLKNILSLENNNISFTISKKDKKVKKAKFFDNNLKKFIEIKF